MESTHQTNKSVWDRRVVAWGYDYRWPLTDDVWLFRLFLRSIMQK